MGSIRFCSQEAAKVLDKLVEGLTGDLSEDGDKVVASRKIGDGKGFMPVTVEFLRKGTFHGDLFSVCHYYEQNGDLMRDPEVTFYRTPGGKAWFPATYQQDNLGIYQEFFRFDETGKITGVIISQQRSCAIFCTQWMENIKRQQGL